MGTPVQLGGRGTTADSVSERLGVRRRTIISAPIAPQRAKAQVVPLAVPLAAAAIAVFLVRGLS